jgi:hypothetical protein
LIVPTQKSAAKSAQIFAARQNRSRLIFSGNNW